MSGNPGERLIAKDGTRYHYTICECPNCHRYCTAIVEDEKPGEDVYHECEYCDHSFSFMREYEDE